jgi:outer membrane protein W
MGKIVGSRKSLALILGFGILLAAAGFAYGQSETGVVQAKKRKLAGVLRMGVASIPKENYGSDFSYGGGFLILFSDKVALEIIMDRYEIPVSEDLGGLGEGTLQTTPFLFSGQWRFPLQRFTPYAALGAGFYFFHYDPKKPDSHAGPDGSNHEDHSQVYDVTDRFALHLGGGLDYQVTGSLDLCADLRYSLVKTWVQARGAVHVKPEDQAKFYLNALTFYIGFRYYF